MPSPMAAIDLIGSAMRLEQLVADGETLTPDEANDALLVLNDLLENWSTEPLTVFGQLNNTFQTVPGQATYTVGPGGDWVTTVRPVRVRDGFITFQGVDFPVTQWGMENYDIIALKTLQQAIVEKFVYVNDNPLGRVILYPTPAQALTISLGFDRILSAVPTLQTVLTFPPGYMMAIRYSLAIALAGEYGKEPKSTTIRIAAASKADIKRANKKLRIASVDNALLNSRATWQLGY